MWTAVSNGVCVRGTTDWHRCISNGSIFYVQGSVWMQLVCAWCGTVLVADKSGIVSHGICKICYDKVMRELESDAVYKYQTERTESPSPKSGYTVLEYDSEK